MTKTTQNWPRCEPDSVNLAPPETSPLLQWVQEATGLEFKGERVDHFASCVARFCQQHDFASSKTLLDTIGAAPQGPLAQQFIHAVTTHHSYFFREKTVLNFFKETVAPPLLEGREPLQLWSAACASGEELYTIAILLSELLGAPVHLRGKVKLVGSDIDESLIIKAQAGVYSARITATVPQDIRDRYFGILPNGNLQIKQELREVCHFLKHNLIHPQLPIKPKLHVIFCRNVLYYLSKPARAEVLERLSQILHPNGWLVLGVTERLGKDESNLNSIIPGVYQKDAGEV